MYFTGKSLWEIVTGAETVNNEASESQKKNQKTIATNLKFMFILLKLQINGSSRPDVFCKKRLLKNYQNSQQNTCTRVFSQVFFCEF